MCRKYFYERQHMPSDWWTVDEYVETVISKTKELKELYKNIRNKKEISQESIDNEIINELLDKFNSQGIEIKLMDITADLKITTIAASADDTVLKDPALLTLGVGTHLNPEVAVIRALTEVAQSRATQIHGTREDTIRADFMRKSGYEHMKRMNTRVSRKRLAQTTGERNHDIDF